MKQKRFFASKFTLFYREKYTPIPSAYPQTQYMQLYQSKTAKPNFISGHFIRRKRRDKISLGKIVGSLNNFLIEESRHKAGLPFVMKNAG